MVPNFSKKEEQKPDILLPEDYRPQQERYISATIVDVSPDCSSHLKCIKSGRGEVVVDRGMIEEISYKDKTYYLILENYVVGILQPFNKSAEYLE